jgi:hypothetical protein
MDHVDQMLSAIIPSPLIPQGKDASRMHLKTRKQKCISAII